MYTHIIILYILFYHNVLNIYTYMEDIFKDAPIQLVSIKEDGDFEITVDGINFLSALKNRKVLYNIN